MAFDAETLAGLSDEERAAIEDDEADATPATDNAETGELPPLTNTDDNGDDDDDEDDDDQNDDDSGDDDDDDAASAAAAAAQAASQEQAAKPEPAPAPAPAPVPEPFLMTPRVENYDTLMGELKGKKSELFAQYNEGTLSPEEYQTAVDKVESDIFDMQFQQRQALSDEARKQAADTAAWTKEVANAFVAFKADGIDYQNDPEKQDVLDSTLKMLAGMKRNEDKTGMWFLQEAHKLVKVQYNLTGNVPAKNETKQDPPARRSRQPDLSNLPRTLANAPVARDESHAGEFSHLEGLGGMEIEMAVARMTPEQQDRWARDN